MKAVILAAGYGKRMMPYTKNKPKPLINVNGNPFLYYMLKKLKTAGITEIGIVYSDKKEKYEEFFEKYGFKAQLLNQPIPLGTGDALKYAEEFTKDDEFLVLPGDCLFSERDIKKIIDSKYENAVLACHRKDTHKYGVIEKKNGCLKKIIEKPKNYGPGLVNTSIYKLDKSIYKYLKDLKKSERGEYELTDAVTQLVNEKDIYVEELKHYWLDFGTPKDIPVVEEKL